MLTIEKRLRVLEERYIYIPGYPPGTQLSRTVQKGGKSGWVLGLGGLDKPKTFFYGDTIDDVLRQAEG